MPKRRFLGGGGATRRGCECVPVSLMVCGSLKVFLVNLDVEDRTTIFGILEESCGGGVG